MFFNPFIYFTGKGPYIPDPNDPFNEPEWDIQQLIAWLQRKQRKDQLKQDTSDPTRLDYQNMSVECEKQIEKDMEQ